jgi:hypothetical protein
MASEQGAVSVAPANSNLLEPATVPTTTTVSVQDSDPSRTKSLKRNRPEQSQNSGSLSSIAHVGLGASPSPKSPRFKGAFSPVFAPIPLTGAAALADERRQREENQKNHTPAMSENPAHKALSSLVAGGGAAISKPRYIDSQSKGIRREARNQSRQRYQSCKPRDFSSNCYCQSDYCCKPLRDDRYRVGKSRCRTWCLRPTTASGRAYIPS